MYAELGELIEAAALQPDRWTDVVAALQVATGGTRISMQSHDMSRPTAEPLIASGWDENDLDTYGQYYANINPWAGPLQKMPLLVPTLSDHVLPLSQLRKSEFYNDWLKPVQAADSATGVRLIDRDGRFAVLAVHYSSRRSAQFHPELQKLLMTLAPKMRDALEMNSHTFRRTIAVPTGSLVHSMFEPAICVDREGHLLDFNAAAETGLLNPRIIRLSPDRTLSFGAAQENAAIYGELHNVCVHGRPSVDSPTISFGPFRFAVSFFALNRRLIHSPRRDVGSFFADRIVALLVFRDIPQLRQSRAESLRTLYRLTPSEIRVAEAFMNGSSPQECANAIGMKYETFRSYLKNIYKKVGVHSQKELLRLLQDKDRLPAR
ncbi:DNA-binding CsgD family transcriptional regulator [Pseudochelatococcus lubricantis]|uniref:DNA-binding CsgD family transcriptional regulator n=1 Tax=Pseudochelatococcus lubricantis TaxID=1538102 RepID=A0ABX0V409_9HYPH|nr:DNA-binding CsgD family transcriptional regulator [Pseudochelatococcus lubricantis]